MQTEVRNEEPADYGSTLKNPKKAKQAPTERQLQKALALIRDHAMRRAPSGGRMNSPAQCANWIYAAIHADLKAGSQERFYMLSLNQQNIPIALDLIEEGIENRCQIYMKKCAKIAFSRNATAVIVAHNHPSCRMEWSSQDRDLTERLRKMFEPLEIRLLDHLLFSPAGEYLSETEGGAPRLVSGLST